MATQVAFSTIDHSGEMSSTKVYVEQLDNSNYDDIFGVAGHVALLAAELALCTDCVVTGWSASVNEAVNPAVPPSTVTAQREIAIRVKYVDSVNGRYGTFNIPGPKTTLYPPRGVKDDIVPLDNVILAALIIVAEAQMVSRDDNAIEIIEARLVGRNN